ncbi:MAG TPA: hypothetical protein VF883_02205 [Thermoanaerobaculia bacterium]|jgi:hypothetical protein
MRRIGSWLWSKRSALLFAAVAACSLPGMVRLVRQTIALAPLDVEARRVAVMGDFYSSLRAVPRNEPAAILLLGKNALDRGVFVNYYLYPTPARMHHDRLSTDAPRSIVAVAAEGPIRRTVIAHPPPAEESQVFIVPFVASAIGKDSYTTEAVFEGDAEVTLRLLPFGVTKTITAPYVFSDVVQEILGRRGTGWLRVEATKPVRAAFWFVARADAVSTPLPLMTHSTPASRTFHGGERLWLLNPSNVPTVAAINGQPQLLPAHELRMQPAAPVTRVEGDVIAFTSEKMAFTW